MWECARSAAAMIAALELLRRGSLWPLRRPHRGAERDIVDPAAASMDRRELKPDGWRTTIALRFGEELAWHSG